jgi:lipopolysaccharide export system protein LptA
MTTWQRRLRFALGVFGLVMAVVVFLAIQKRAPAPQAAPSERLDPKAQSEVARGQLTLTKGSKETVKVAFDHELSYANGVSKLQGVTVSIDERGGRRFTLKGNEAEVGPNQSSYTIVGQVKLIASDGFTAETDQASYVEGEGVVRAPGKVTFARDRMRGSGVGMMYDKNRDVLWLLDQAEMTIAPDERGQGSLVVHAGAAGLARADKYMKFERDVKMTRDGKIIESDSATAFLTDDEKHLKTLELHGHSRITPQPGGPGSVQEMTASEMNLAYAPDGEVLQHATLSGQSVIQLAGDPGGRGSRISAEALNIDMAPDSSLTGLIARDNVQTEFAAAKGQPSRVVRSISLDGKGEPGRGLTAATFKDNVEYRETLPGNPPVVRVVRSRQLDAVLDPATATIQEGTFTGAVRFEEGSMSAFGAIARYNLSAGTVELSGVEQTRRPSVADERIRVEARSIEMKPEGRHLLARTEVRSTLLPSADKPAAPSAPAPAGASHMPRMLESDESVSVTGDRLEYEGDTSLAVYTGNARLWQGDTSVNADTLTLDNAKGDLTAVGAVRTSWMVDAAKPAPDGRSGEGAPAAGRGGATAGSTRGAAPSAPAGPPAKTQTLATGNEMHYDDALRRATYTGNAHVVGTQGDVTAAKIELYLSKDTNDLERVEAYEAVTVRVDKRTATGGRMTFVSAEEKYVMTGSPVKIVDECSESTGSTLTFYKSTDTIRVDGRERRALTTKNGVKCQ